MGKKLKRLFCHHKWERVAWRKSQWCQDFLTFSDLGMWNDIKYVCAKCGKEKIMQEKNQSHPLCPKPWQKF